jgi:serine/threonine protein kinase
VYLVERMAGGVLQRSALKVLAPHAAGPAFVERFHREQHILASLDHPNITRMLDGGLSEEGQPYLVMEYVDGAPLDVYCDERNLGIEERLKLSLRVCDAVAYAHRNLVVHLDLKPSNIFVTADGAVKLLDFGTSKLIQTDSLLTTTKE